MDEGILYKITDDIENLSIFGYDVSYTYLNDNWAPHYHRALELIYILEGTATVFMTKQKYTLKPKDILVIDSMKPQIMSASVKNISAGISKRTPDTHSWIFSAMSGSTIFIRI